MATTDKTISTSLPGISAKEMLLSTYKYMAADGVCKALVHTIAPSGDGTYATEPYFNPTSYNATGGTEGTTLTATQRTLISATRRSYTAAESVEFTHQSFYSDAVSAESVRDLHTSVHAHTQAKRLEQKILATFASFTNSITATSTSGLTWAKIAAARVLLEGGTAPAPGPFVGVISPNQEYQLAINMAALGQNYGPVGKIANDVLETFHKGTYAGVDFHISPYIVAATAAVGAIFSKESIGLLTPQPLKYFIQEIARDRGFDIVSSFYYGARVRVPAFGVKLTALGVNPS